LIILNIGSLQENPLGHLLSVPILTRYLIVIPLYHFDTLSALEGRFLSDLTLILRSTHSSIILLFHLITDALKQEILFNVGLAVLPPALSSSLRWWPQAPLLVRNTFINGIDYLIDILSEGFLLKFTPSLSRRLLCESLRSIAHSYVPFW